MAAPRGSQDSGRKLAPTGRGAPAPRARAPVAEVEIAPRRPAKPWWRSKMFITTVAGLLSGVIAYAILSYARPALFGWLRDAEWFQRLLAGRSALTVRNFAAIINDALGFAIFGGLFLPAIVWAAEIYQGGNWRPSLRALAKSALSVSFASAILISLLLVVAFAIEREPDDAARRWTVLASWTLLGPVYGAILSQALPQIPLVQSVPACTAGGLAAGLLWILLFLGHLDPNGVFRFPLAGAVLAAVLVAIRSYVLPARGVRRVSRPLSREKPLGSRVR